MKHAFFVILYPPGQALEKSGTFILVHKTKITMGKNFLNLCTKIHRNHCNSITSK